MAQIERKKADFEDFQRFEIQSRSFSKQFCGIYKARLASLKSKVLKRAKLKWSKFIHILSKHFKLLFSETIKSFSFHFHCTQKQFSFIRVITIFKSCFILQRKKRFCILWI